MPRFTLLAPGCQPSLAVVIISLGLALPATAAGRTPSTTQQAVAYSHCMRSHGVPSYPDPQSNGQLPKGTAQQFGVSSYRYQAAQNACRHLLPNNDTKFTAALTECLQTGSCPSAVVQQALTEGRTFAQCMRHDGVPNWPDPTTDSMGRPSFQVTAAGISIAATRSPRMLSKIGYCQRHHGLLLRQE